MTTKEFFTSTWQWHPWVTGICLMVMLIGITSPYFRSPRRCGWLIAGLAILFLTLASPLDVLASGYLFSAHMLQHLLLLLVVPAMFLKSLPATAIPQLARKGPGRPLNWILRHSVATWLMGVGGMWVWHIPALCNAAVTSEWVERFQFVSLLAMGFAFWWPVIGPWREQWLSPLLGIVYLSSACLGCTLLGIILAFAPGGIYGAYLHPMDQLGILPLIQNQWGLTPARDEQLGGLLMWVPACLIYFCGVCGLLARWYGEDQIESITPVTSLNKPIVEKSHGH